MQVKYMYLFETSYAVHFLLVDISVAFCVGISCALYGDCPASRLISSVLGCWYCFNAFYCVPVASIDPWSEGNFYWFRAFATAVIFRPTDKLDYAFQRIYKKSNCRNLRTDKNQMVIDCDYSV